MAHRVGYSLDWKRVNVQSVQLSLKLGQYAFDLVRCCPPGEIITSSDKFLLKQDGKNMVGKKEAVDRLKDGQSLSSLLQRVQRLAAKYFLSK